MSILKSTQTGIYSKVTICKLEQMGWELESSAQYSKIKKDKQHYLNTKRCANGDYEITIEFDANKNKAEDVTVVYINTFADLQLVEGYWACKNQKERSKARKRLIENTQTKLDPKFWFADIETDINKNVIRHVSIK